MKKKICVILIAVLVAVLGTSTYFIIDHYKEANKQAELYDELADLVDAAAQTDAETEPVEQIPYSEEKMLLPELAELYQQNGDLVGWISIADTNINYPVMQSVNEPNFYLKHGFDKEYSDYGCPYVQEDCDVQEPSDNLVIYGHHMFSDGHETKVKENPLNENFAKREFQALWREINHKYAYTVDFDSAELIRNAIAHIDEKLFVSELQYTTTIGRQKTEMNEYEIERGASFTGEKTRTQTLKHAETSQIKYDLIGKIAEGTVLTRRTVSAILQGIRVDKLYMFKNNPEEFITKVIRLINEQKATMIVEHISYDTIEGEYDSSIFTAEKATQSFDKAFLAKKAIQDYVFTDGSADKSIERKFAEDLDAADEVCVYAKLPRTFQIPTPVGNYSPDWAIAFYEGKVKHIFFIAETKGTMESLELRPIEQAKISCAKKLFNEMFTSNVVYHDVDSYQSLLNIMNSI